MYDSKLLHAGRARPGTSCVHCNTLDTISFALQVDKLIKWRLETVKGVFNFHHPDGGDGYTEWYRGVDCWETLHKHILAVIRLVRGMWNGQNPRLGLN